MAALAIVLGAGKSFLELLAIVFIIAFPTIPITYLVWTGLAEGRGKKAKEVTSGASSATPFALLSIVSTVVLVAAIAVLLLVIGVRAALT
jgi:hypothetical protein